MRTPILIHALTMATVHAMVETSRHPKVVLVAEVPRPTTAELFEAMVIAEMSQKKRTKFMIEIPFRDAMESKLGVSTFRKESQPFAQFAKNPSKRSINKRHR